MSRRYVIGDTHLSHRNLANFRKLSSPITGTPYTSEEQNEMMVEELSKVGKRDLLIFLGDIAFTKEALGWIKNLPCNNKLLIAGNHDTSKTITMQDLVDTFDKVFAVKAYAGCWLQHAPMHPMELRGRYNMHGHTHYQCMLSDDGLLDQRYINVCAEYTGYKPIHVDYALSAEYHEECQEKFDKYVELGRCSGIKVV